MDANQRRIELAKAYPGEAWRLKVKDMTDRQVTAVYLNLKSKGIIK